MIWSKLRFQQSLGLFPRVLKEVTPVLLPLNIFLWILEFYVGVLNQARFEDPYLSMTPLLVFSLVGILYQGFFAVIWTLYVARSSERQMKNGHGPHPFVFLKTHFHQSLIEYIRAMISIGLYFLLLFVPGIIRWVQLLFVCLVSSFDRDYLAGKRDALKESGRLVRGGFTALFFLALLQNFLPFVIQMTSNFSSSNFVLATLVHLFAWVLCIYFSIYFSLTFFARTSFKMENP